MKLIEIKHNKAILLLTHEEYIAALKRGKAVLRRKSLAKRLESGDERSKRASAE
ncbi:MAG: hypothetical protein IBX64_09970 [Actinobacteria bacterium]|nr:hypothetical protein [Actinomycetota bacterium]